MDKDSKILVTGALGFLGRNNPYKTRTVSDFFDVDSIPIVILDFCL